MQSKVPHKTLIGRDPRNDEHVRQAASIMQDHSEIHMMERAIAELRMADIPVPDSVKARKMAPRKSTMAVGGSFLLEVGLYYPDNVIRQCSVCRAPLQFRPTIGHSPAIYLCMFCAAERVLKNYWERRAKRPGRR
jgi:hypothetical protein